MPPVRFSKDLAPTDPKALWYYNYRWVRTVMNGSPSFNAHRERLQWKNTWDAIFNALYSQAFWISRDAAEAHFYMQHQRNASLYAPTERWRMRHNVTVPNEVCEFYRVNKLKGHR